MSSLRSRDIGFALMKLSSAWERHLIRWRFALSAKIPQWKKNLAKEMFTAGDVLDSLGRTLLQSDLQQPTVEDLRRCEDDLLGGLLMVRQIRHKLVENPVHVKGQRA